MRVTYVSFTAEYPDTSESHPTLGDARTALQELVTSQGMDKGFEILGQFGAARVGELKAEDYDAFVAACRAA